MRYCKKCLQPDTRPGIQFNDEGLCPPCQFSSQYVNIDWNKRRAELEEICEFGRRNNVSGYDCIVGVSGGKDSLRQCLFVRDELRLKPLLVSCVYPPEQMTNLGAYNISNLISLGFDCISVSPNPQVWKTFMREGFLKHGNWCRATEMALYSCLPKVAIAYRTPVIFLGENAGIALGDLKVGVTGDGNKIKDSNTLQGGPDAIRNEDIAEKDLFWYRFPSDDEMVWGNIRITYLGYYMTDFTRFKNGEVALANGLKVRSDPSEDIGVVYKYEALDEDFSLINQMLKHIKLGFGKCSDQICEAIRLGMMTREEGIELVKRYDGKIAHHYIQRFCCYLEITEEQFWEVVERFRNKDIWEKDQQGHWRLKVPVGVTFHETNNIA